jgi:hydroxyacylglutathione hydrolase
MTTQPFSSRRPNSANPAVIDIECDELRAHLNEVHIIDVRRPDEWNGELGHIAEAQLITLDTLPEKLSTLPKDKPIVFVCRSGARSASASAFAISHGFLNTFNLAGGMIAWNKSKA